MGVSLNKARCNSKLKEQLLKCSLGPWCSLKFREVESGSNKKLQLQVVSSLQLSDLPRIVFVTCEVGAAGHSHTASLTTHSLTAAGQMDTRWLLPNWSVQLDSWHTGMSHTKTLSETHSNAQPGRGAGKHTWIPPAGCTQCSTAHKSSQLEAM